MPQLVKIGKLTMAVQAVIVFATALLASLVVLALGIYSGQAVVAGIMATAIMAGGAVGAYQMNCIVVGACNVFAWVLTGINIFYVLMVVLSVSRMGKKTGKK